MVPAPLISDTHFLQRDSLYEVEKPYSLRFTPPSTFPRANIKLEKHTISINDIRSKHKPVTFAQHGFEILPFKSRLPYADFDDDDAVKRVYLREAANLIRDFLGAQNVQIFEHTVRKRHEEFPISTGESYKWNQPTSIAHVDTTTSWAIDMAKQLNPNNPLIGKHRIQCVKCVSRRSNGLEQTNKFNSLWKPLKGPVKDWPLALCDPVSINVKSDLEPCDLVYPDYVVENRQLYWSEGQEWWWCRDQMEDEAWIFLQSDTDTKTKPGKCLIGSDGRVIYGANCREVPHTAFRVEGENGEPRESIELRALVYYGGV